MDGVLPDQTLLAFKAYGQSRALLVKVVQTSTLEHLSCVELLGPSERCASGMDGEANISDCLNGKNREGVLEKTNLKTCHDLSDTWPLQPETTGPAICNFRTFRVVQLRAMHKPLSLEHLSKTSSVVPVASSNSDRFSLATVASNC